MVEVGEGDKARPILYRTLKYQLATLGSNSLETAVTQNYLGVLLLESGEKSVESEAESLLLAVRAVRSRAEPPLYGPDSMSVVATEDQLAGLYMRQDRKQEALPLLEHIVSIRSAELGDIHPQTEGPLRILAALREAEALADPSPERYHLAIELKERVLAVLEHRIAAETDGTSVTAGIDGEADGDSALKLNNDPHPRSREKLELLESLGALYAEIEDNDQALFYWEQAHTISEAIGFTSGRMASMLNNMAVAYRRLGTCPTTQLHPLLFIVFALSVFCFLLLTITLRPLHASFI
eukprot:SAG31_NODE_2216_length_6171_cov_1.851120_2_plen_295_part_00